MPDQRHLVAASTPGRPVISVNASGARERGQGTGPGTRSLRDGTTRTVPAALVREVRAIAGDRPLVPVVTLHTTRIERRLLDADGNALAAIADDTVHGQRLTGAAAEETTWREVEVELLDGDRAVLDDVSGRLRAAGLTPSRSGSKLARALGDFAAAPPPAVRDAMSRARRAPAGVVVLAYLQEHVDRLVTCERGVRSDEPEAVHDMRVATRRLRSTLATYRPLLDREQTDPLREELKWLGEALGRPRDAEVLHQRMLDLVAAQPDGSTGPPAPWQTTGRRRHETRGSTRSVSVRSRPGTPPSQPYPWPANGPESWRPGWSRCRTCSVSTRTA